MWNGCKLFFPSSCCLSFVFSNKLQLFVNLPLFILLGFQSCTIEGYFTYSPNSNFVLLTLHLNCFQQNDCFKVNYSSFYSYPNVVFFFEFDICVSDTPFWVMTRYAYLVFFVHPAPCSMHLSLALSVSFQLLGYPTSSPSSFLVSLSGFFFFFIPCWLCPLHIVFHSHLLPLFGTFFQ